MTGSGRVQTPRSYLTRGSDTVSEMRESEKSHVMDARDSKKKNGGKSERQRTALWVNHVEARVGEGMKGLPHVMDVGGDDLSLGEFVLRRSLRPRGY